jgi:hypothetical protein
MNKPRIARILFVALALLAASLPAVPQTAARYTIEFVLFRNDADRSGEDGSAAAPLQSTETDLSVATTPVASRRLGTAASKLRSAGNYRILAHASWTQAPAAWNSRRGVPVSALGLSVPGLSGNVIFERGQLLHLGFDLKYQEGDRTLQFAEIRKVKLEDAQYFDHPQLGIIALVTASK